MWSNVLLDLLGFGAVVLVGVLLGLPLFFLLLKYTEWIAKKLGM